MTFERLYQELSHSTKMIRALTAGISQEDAQIKPTPKTWSTLEVICHLYNEEREDFREHLDFILHRQMLAAWIAHDNLHIRQLVELRRHRIEQMNEPSDLKYAGDW